MCDNQMVLFSFSSCDRFWAVGQGWLSWIMQVTLFVESICRPMNSVVSSTWLTKTQWKGSFNNQNFKRPFCNRVISQRQQILYLISHSNVSWTLSFVIQWLLKVSDGSFPKHGLMGQIISQVSSPSEDFFPQGKPS